MCFWLGCPHVPDLVGDQVVQGVHGVQPDLSAKDVQEDVLDPHLAIPNLPGPGQLEEKEYQDN